MKHAQFLQLFCLITLASLSIHLPHQPSHLRHFSIRNALWLLFVCFFKASWQLCNNHTWIPSWSVYTKRGCGRGDYDEMKSQEMKHCWQAKISSLMLSLLQLHIRSLFPTHRLELKLKNVCFCVDLKILITYAKDLWWLFESLDTFFLSPPPPTCFRSFYYFYDNNNWGMAASYKWNVDVESEKTYQTSISRFSQIYWKVFFILCHNRKCR